ncbi:MAG: di-trans,poly-cis-decaprenylcistransferase [Candidatus Omnitrophica bacterium]|nr:di-trans,poly-cis-decaprenylcistransferase [Candidatus Omnitrophota bacterium]
MKIPQHIAIVMDGNGRWAGKRHLPRIMGHRKGKETARQVTSACSELGVKFLTLFAFSRENWKRPKLEVNFLMKLLEHAIDSELEYLKREEIRVMTIGSSEGLSERLIRKIRRTTELTKDHKRINLVVALNYGGRQEIINSIRRLASGKSPEDIQQTIDALTPEVFDGYLDTAGIPDPDLVIRTSGEMRLSNFLLWQSSYSEWVVSPKFWPDFTREDLIDAVAEYSERNRRYGGLR